MKKPKLPTNTVESYVRTIDREKFQTGREIVTSVVAQAMRMNPVTGNEMLKRRLGIDLDPDFIPGLDDGNGPKREDYER